MDIGLIKRGINHYHTKLVAFFNEKKFRAAGTRVKYMLLTDKQSDALLVSFPSCAPNTAKYNYMRTLIPFKCNKLFLLDDFGDNHQGCYLIEDKVEQCVKQLLETVISRTKPLVIIFLGSSKGGYSALNFAFLIPNVTVVIGAPQYYLGSYLDKPNTLTNLKYIIGDLTPEKKSQLDVRLKQKIDQSSVKPKQVYFHYSNVEHTYEEHVNDLLKDLKASNVHITEDVQDYPRHDQLSDFFPPYLLEVCSKLISER